MRYDLLLRRHDTERPVYIGQAESKGHAKEWAKARLRKEDVRYGDRIEARPVGDASPFVIE